MGYGTLMKLDVGSDGYMYYVPTWSVITKWYINTSFANLFSLADNKKGK